MIITFLDWEKAFDKVQHCRLLIALRRLGIHDTFIEVLKDCSTKAPFFVEDEYGTSTAKLQSAGIRQGCPLSPYLFVLLMSVVNRDVALNLETAYQRRNPNKLPDQIIYYADDTVWFPPMPRRRIDGWLKLMEFQNSLAHIWIGTNVVISLWTAATWSSLQTDRNWTEWKKRPTLDTKSPRKWTLNTRYNTKCTRHWKCGLSWTPSGRQQFVLIDGSCKFMMPFSETNFSMDSRPYTSHKRSKGRWMHCNCGAYVKSWVSAQLVSTVQMQTNMYRKRQMKKLATHLGHPAK